MTHTKTILLFDMDGVLLQADGYHRALQSSVSLIGRNLGIKDPVLTREQIARFEAAGVTHEWETLAICSAMMLIQVWRTDPEIRLPARFDPAAAGSLIRWEDHFTPFLAGIDLDGRPPTVYAERVLQGRAQLNEAQIAYLKLVLHSGIDCAVSPTLPVFQEYVLGSRTFSETYSQPGCLATDSYLLQYDRPALTSSNLERLLGWLEEDAHQAVIFTNRPSAAPEGFFSTPEAELGAAAAGLGELPLVGAGSLSWLAEQESRPWHSYYKPHPVHALAALQLALGSTLAQALKAASQLYREQAGREAWLPLDGSRVVVFEDLAAGLLSVRSAQGVLQDLGIGLKTELIGVGVHPSKTSALSKITSTIVEDLNQGISPGIIA